MIAYIFWNPSREAFSFFSFSVYWYSVFFAIGFYGALLCLRFLIHKRFIFLHHHENPSLTQQYTETLAWYVMIGIIIFARLGHILFYDFSYYLSHKLEILNLRQGGLSSHGGIIGLFFALWLFNKKKWNFFPKKYDLLDALCAPSAWLATCIRIGNFFNQEIIGLETTRPWAILFGSPTESIQIVPRHPTQLYEALVYFTLFLILFAISFKGNWASNGLRTGWYLLLIFISRCFIEQYKVAQCAFDTSSLHMGQILSIPLLVFALFLIIRHALKSKEQTELHHAIHK